MLHTESLAMRENRSRTCRTGVGVLLFTALFLGRADAQPGVPVPPLRQVSLRVQINSALPDYAFFFTQDTVHISSDYLHSHQTVKTLGDPPGDPAEFFVLHDINFDGYLDLSTLERGGAKWGVSHYLVFDKKSGHFISNWLTRKLDQFKHNGIHPDAKSKEIRVDYLVVGEGLVSESYEIQGAELVLVETKEMNYDAKTKSSTITTKRLTGGKMKVIKTEPR